MLLKSLGALFISLTGIAKAQAPTNNSSQTNPYTSQYGSGFSNIGGKVLSGYVNAYVIFYGDWSSENGTTDQKTFLNFIDGVYSTSWFSILDQYSDNSGPGATRSLNLAAAINDKGSQGFQLSDHNTHKNIVLGAVQSGYLSENNQLDSDGVYIIVAGKDVNDSEFCDRNCGYNSYSDQFQYVFIGYPGHCPMKCIPEINRNNSPNNSPTVDAQVTILSHELQDILTDPRNDAWVIGKNGNGEIFELGDFCLNDKTDQTTWFGTLKQTENKGSYNLVVSDTNKYLVTSIYSKQKNACLTSDE
ncbi:unnamed protein product [Cunninghamella echinulata]